MTVLCTRTSLPIFLLFKRSQQHFHDLQLDFLYDLPAVYLLHICYFFFFSLEEFFSGVNMILVYSDVMQRGTGTCMIVGHITHIGTADR